MNDAVAEGFSGEFSVCDCDRYAEHLADISVRRRMVIASDDVRNQFGVLLLARGAPLAGTTSFEKQAVRLEVPVEAARVVMGVELISEGAVFVRELSVAVAE